MAKKSAKLAKKAKAKKKETGYDASNIQVLEGLEAVRKRPGMYIGSTDETGLHHCVWEVVDNGIDEAMAGHCDQVDVVVHKDGAIGIRDNGRGIPVEIHPQTKKSTLETVMTVLHAGGKFGGGGYKVSGGLHGVGVSVVNALSKKLVAEVHRGGEVWQQEYKNGGKPAAKAKKIGTCRDHGTQITFWPDDTIFETIEFDYETLRQRLRQSAYLTRGITIRLKDERTGRKDQFYFEGGIKSYVAKMNEERQAIGEGDVFYCEKDTENGYVEVAMQYNDSFNETVLSFVNNINTPGGGTHISGFRTALTRVMNSYALKQKLVTEKEGNFQGEDVREGLTVIVSVKVADPQFEGQTKHKLGSPEVKGAVESVFGEALATYLEERPNTAKAIIGKCSLARKARIASRAARDTVIRKSALEGMTLPGKLADCSSRKAENSEIYIVEGDSAGGSGKQGRDRETQAILPLRGKVLNTEGARLDKVLSFEEIKALVIALGTSIGETFEVEKLRYNKIIIMTDADVDGSHIRTLLLTFFYRHMKKLIKGGHIYIAQPPLYQIRAGKEGHYVYTEEQKVDLLKELGKDENQVTIQRYKGLGEMNPEQLWETTMNPESRRMLRVTIEDGVRADQIFTTLMGNEVAPRRKFISTHAASVENLDV